VNPRLKTIRAILLGFALLLLSMFFFHVARGGRTLIARRAVTAMSSRSFLWFAHGPPITRLHSYDRNAPHLARPRRDPPRVDRGPPWRHCFCRARGPNRRFKSAKTAPPLRTLPSAVGSCVAPARFPHPCAVTPLAAGVLSVHARASWSSVAPAPPLCEAVRDDGVAVEQVGVERPLATRPAILASAS